MGLLKVGINNKILQWRAKTHQVDIHIIELLVGLVVGFFLVAAGAYMGEAIQEKRERASLAAQDEEEAFY